MSILGIQQPQLGNGPNRDDGGDLAGSAGCSQLPVVKTEGVYVAKTVVEVWMPVDPTAMASAQAVAADTLYGPGESPVAWQPSTAYRYGQAVVMTSPTADIHTGLYYPTVYICNQRGYVSGTSWSAERDYVSPLDPTIVIVPFAPVPDYSYVGNSVNSLWIYDGYDQGNPYGSHMFAGYLSTPPTSDWLAARAAGFDPSVIGPLTVAYRSRAPYIIPSWHGYYYTPTAFYNYDPVTGLPTTPTGKISPAYSAPTTLFQLWGVPRLTNIQYIP